MEKNIIPQEDNTSEILKADLLKYGYVNKRNKLRKNKTNANPAKRQEWAIRFLEEERNNLAIDLNVMESQTKVKEDEKYRATFLRLIHETNQAKIELTEQRKIEAQVNNEIVQWETELEKWATKNRMPVVSTTTTTTANNEYNRLLEEQSQLKMQVEILLKRWQQIQNVYNLHMNKLNKGKEIASILTEQVKRTYTYRNEAKERLETYLKTSKAQNSNYENHILSLKRQVDEDLTMTTFLSEKLKIRYIKQTEKSYEDNTEMLALNVEAETFIKHLVHIADEKNLETIMEQIVKMDLDNKCMFRFLIQIESHLTDAENTIEESRIVVTDRKRALCDTLEAKKEELASAVRAYKAGRAPLREAYGTLRLMADEWRQTCRTVDDACQLMMGTDSRRPSYRLLVRDDDDDDDDGTGAEEEEDTANVSDDHGSNGHRHHRHRRRRRRRRAQTRDSRRPPTAIVSELIAYFEPMDRRLDDVLHRLFWTQNNYVQDGYGAEPEKGPKEVAAGDSMSTASEQEDVFLARDLDGTINRHAKVVAALDPTTVTADPETLDGSQVPSLCPRCIEKCYEEENQWVLRYINKIQGGRGTPPVTSRVCQSQNVNITTIENEEFKKFFHRTLDCPLYSAENFHAE